MLETTVRIVEGGAQVVVPLRRMRITASHVSPELLQRVCSRLRIKHGLAAIPDLGGFADEPSILVATDGALPNLTLADQEWQLTARDTREAVTQLTLGHPAGREWLPLLIERALLARLQRTGRMWTLDSPRIWHESEPFMADGSVVAYRRYEAGALVLEGIGIGATVDVGTAFFGKYPLSYYLDRQISSAERQDRQDELHVMLERQQGQKGTLDYYARGHQKCYFEDAPAGLTCGTTGILKIERNTYPSLTTYYAEKAPTLNVTDGELAVRVSFPGLDLPVWVAARFVRPRIMNESIPERLRNVYAVRPAERRSLLTAFWKTIDSDPLGKVARLQRGFWRPEEAKVHHVTPVAIEFGARRRVSEPVERTVAAYTKYYRDRLRVLQEAGCYRVPPSLQRVIHVAHPKVLADGALSFATALAAQIEQWVGVSFSTNLVAYDSLQDGIEQVRRVAEPGVAVFIIGDEPAAYHDVAFQLEGWRIKRVTRTVLNRHVDALEHGSQDKRHSGKTLEVGRAKWQSFISMNALDLIQQMDIVPWRIDMAAFFDAQLVIDVGHDRRHVSISLLVARNEQRVPSFVVYTLTEPKPDPKHEAINQVLLADQVVKVASTVQRRRFDPIESLLVMRDGQLVGEEITGIHRATERLRQRGFLTQNAVVSIVELHKSTLKPIRAWEIDESGTVSNALENTMIELSKTMLMVLTTGAATVHQGTADPLLLVSRGSDDGVLAAGKSVCASAQLNWSSPGVAQRLPLPFKRTDEELKARAAQEIRRIR